MFISGSVVLSAVERVPELPGGFRGPVGWAELGSRNKWLAEESAMNGVGTASPWEQTSGYRRQASGEQPVSRRQTSGFRRQGTANSLTRGRPPQPPRPLLPPAKTPGGEGVPSGCEMCEV